MVLFIGTREGVHRAPTPPFDAAEPVLDCGRAFRVRTVPAIRGVLVASETGLHHSRSGATWTDLGVPLAEVYAVAAGPEGERIYAGTHPAHIYASEDRGRSWRELLGFRALPSRDEWHTPRHRGEAHVRSLHVHPEAPDRVIAGVEVGGVHVSDDRGETWEERREGVHDDVHHVLVRSPDEYVASCGGGLFRTETAGRSWTRLDGELDHTYFREAFFRDGTLYAAAARDAPPSWNGPKGADAALYESTDGGDSFERVPYEGEPEEVVLAWAGADGDVIAGTNEGRILVREDGGWVTAGRVPAGVSSLAAL